MVNIPIKICGLQSGDDMRFTSHPEIAHFGFIFVPNRRRTIQPAAARQLRLAADGQCQAIGVFANQTMEEVLRIADHVGLAGIQFHGDESIRFCRKIRQRGYSVWKSVPVYASNHHVGKLVAQIEQYADNVDILLLDTAIAKDGSRAQSGGLGTTFDWRVLQEAAVHLVAAHRAKLWVAGGIAEANVGELLSVYQPAGIDISSSVEFEGRKSMSKIESFLEAVRAI